jgi:hypothetical protein
MSGRREGRGGGGGVDVAVSASGHTLERSTDTFVSIFFSVFVQTNKYTQPTMILDES